MSRSVSTEPRSGSVRSRRRRLLLLLGAAALAGCGVKGRLELPEESSAEPEQDEVVRERDVP
jgi:predicted small lipoprotein YifL